MSRPLAICLEDLQPRAPDERYLRCVAVVGRAPGLRVDGAGTVLWRDETGTACELWVSADERLVLYRLAGGGRVVVRRASRSLEVPATKPVILLDQDEVEVGARRFRVHVHGDAPRVHPPEYLRPTSSRGPAKVAAALALGAALGAAGCRKETPATNEPRDIEVRTAPPVVAEPVPPPDAATAPGDAGVPTGAGDVGAAGEPDVVPLPDTSPDIEVRVAPPQVPAPMDVGEPPTVASDAGAPDADAGPAAAADAAVGPREDAGHRRRDARTPPPIEVRDLPPFVEQK